MYQGCLLLGLGSRYFVPLPGLWAACAACPSPLLGGALLAPCRGCGRPVRPVPRPYWGGRYSPLAGAVGGLCWTHKKSPPCGGHVGQSDIQVSGGGSRLASQCDHDGAARIISSAGGIGGGGLCGHRTHADGGADVHSTAGGGAVKVTVTGKKELTNVVIDPQVVDPDDVEMLQDLILTAVNDALHQVDAVSEEEMNKVTGGLKIPGM